MRRSSAVTVAGSFLGIGLFMAAFIILAGLVYRGNGDTTALVILLLVLLMSLMMMGIGIMSFRAFSYKTHCDESGIWLNFPLRNEHVLWQNVDCYRNISHKGKFKGGANVWIALKYRKHGQHDRRKKSAILILEGIGPTVAWSAKEYTTVLNRFVPDKDRTKR
jgi:hypothetical protein